MKQNDIAEVIAFYNRKPETLVRHIIPVLDCDLAVYHRPGSSSKGHIIFYHGACGRSQMWAHQYDAFQDVDAILSYFQLDKVILVGHSWGGNPLQEYTYRHPNRVLALVMVDSWGQHRYLSDKERNRIKYSSLMYKTIPWKLIADKNSKMCTDNPITRELVKTAIIETGRDVFLNLGITGFLAVHEIEGYQGNPPMLLVRGENDFPKHLKMIYDGIIALNPNARQVTISDSKHQPMNDHPEEFNQIVGEFFEEVVAL